MRTPTTVRNLVRGAIIVLLAAGIGSVALWNAPAGSAGGNVIVTVDTTGTWTSLALDDSGNPVVSYYDDVDDDLRILHCSNPNCSSGNSVTLPDTEGDVGEYTSLVLDSNGNPVVSYYDRTNRTLKVMHCNDPDCAGGDESITSPDTVGNVGTWNSLALDASGHPVVSYYSASGADLKVLHCNDANCEGDDESITTPDTDGSLGRYTSLTLDGTGNPVVSYEASDDLKVLHCGNEDCGPGNVITTPDTSGSVKYTSLALDSSGNPVVSYLGSNALNVLHCGDASCSSGNSVTAPDTAGIAQHTYTSLALDSSGNPVVGYFGWNNDDLKVLHCNDANCTGDDESVTSPDTLGAVGRYTSLVLDDSGNPVISYAGEGNLKLLHCGDPTCGAGEAETPTGTPTATSPALDTATPTSPAPATSTPVPATATPVTPATSTPVPATATPAGTPGDVNCDGTVSAVDAALVLQWSAGLFSTFTCEGNADVNGDGSVNSIDAALILQDVAGLIRLA